MAEMKRINVTIWDYLDKDIQELNNKNINVSKICRTALNREVIAKKLALSNSDKWKKATDEAANLCFQEKFFEGHDIAREHVKNGKLCQSEMYYMYSEYQHFLDTGLSSVCWYNLCKDEAVSESIAQLMFDSAGQEKSDDVSEKILNINEYFKGIFNRENPEKDKGISFDQIPCYNENMDWLEGYFCFVHRFFCYMLPGFGSNNSSSFDHLIESEEL